MFRKKNATARHLEVEKALIKKEGDERECRVREKMRRDYLNVYVNKWAEELQKEHAAVSCQQHKDMPQGDEGALLAWIHQQIASPHAACSAQRLGEIAQELSYIQALRLELQTEEQIMEFVKIAALTEEMDAFYQAVEKIYEELMQKVEAKIEKSVQAWRQKKAHKEGLEKAISSEEDDMVQRIYLVLEEDILWGVQQIQQAGVASTKKNPLKNSLPPHERHLPTWCNGTNVETKVQKIKNFVEDLQPAALKERIKNSLPSVFQKV